MSQPSPKLELTASELAKVQQMRKRAEGARLEPEWAFIGEFGYYYGWEGIEAILEDKITLEVATLLIRGARRIRYEKVVDYSIATQTAVVAANSKKGKQIMQKGLAHFMKEASNG